MVLGKYNIQHHRIEHKTEILLFSTNPLYKGSYGSNNDHINSWISVNNSYNPAAEVGNPASLDKVLFFPDYFYSGYVQ